ncbi:hypothetical protein SPRG_08450 [Saprolegnia parasitica CBS 223.65]|uniref:F-box domain-containing protein n=1 Tax=Saprolegnia parasitica (strain CBS 223.65) TaxID=695850 RepID=A0A067C5Q0_SAPPC|nr:hypothetical protein SPRG_08450 [Saprolegnia parasitica CBS 223.65]KDO26089.1 hypothetical protein SPRG_08450 [Saprolegnia parasitica CBS 223.65]|eukprot:XP_012203085.1 hypothetical protein SPRG_08450 [Saprolegnia parasitica CBS 223.65]
MDVARFETLPHDLVVRIVGCLDSHGLRALSSTSRLLHGLITERDSLWKNVFRRQWASANFALPAPLVLSPFLAAKYPRHSDAYHYLCQAMRMVPSTMDLDFLDEFDEDDRDEYAITDLTGREVGAPQRFAMTKFLDGEYSEGRSVRSNVPVRFKPTVVVHRPTATGPFVVDVVSTVYFEVTLAATPIEPRDPGDANNTNGFFSVGFIASSFALLENHAGWEPWSYGYHSSDGAYITEPDGPVVVGTYGPSDTVGCGIHYGPGHEATLFLTKNGHRFDTAFAVCPGRALFPCVGTNTTYPVSVNFGATPFRYSPFATDVDDAERQRAIGEAPMDYEGYLDEYVAEDEEDDDDGDGDDADDDDDDYDGSYYEDDDYYDADADAYDDDADEEMYDDDDEYYEDEDLMEQYRGYFFGRGGDDDDDDGDDEHERMAALLRAHPDVQRFLHHLYSHTTHDVMVAAANGDPRELVQAMLSMANDVLPPAPAVARSEAVAQRVATPPAQRVSTPSVDPDMATLEEAMQDLLAETVLAPASSSSAYDSDEELRRKYHVSDDPLDEVD